MIVLGIVAIALGFVLSVPLLIPLGVILLVVGLILEVLGRTGRPVAGRRHYF